MEERRLRVMGVARGEAGREMMTGVTAGHIATRAGGGQISGPRIDGTATTVDIAIVVAPGTVEITGTQAAATTSSPHPGLTEVSDRPIFPRHGQIHSSISFRRPKTTWKQPTVLQPRAFLVSTMVMWLRSTMMPVAALL